jgi:hypothetical protein
LAICREKEEKKTDEKKTGSKKEEKIVRTILFHLLEKVRSQK